MTKSILLGVGGLFLAVSLISAATVIGAGEQGVVTRFGAIKGNTLEPGFHVVAPFIDRVSVFSTRETKDEVDANSASRDLQSVTTKIALNYHLDPVNVNRLFQEIGTEYKARIIDPAIQESVKGATSRFTAEELITKRSEVKQVVKEILSDRLGSRFIIVDDVAIVDFGFSDEFDKSIEAKQVAEQNALKAEQDLKRVEVEAKQKIEQAKAEAESLRLQRENVSSDLIRLREVEANIRAIDKWNGTLPTYTGGVVPFLDINRK
jgi:regulator of protease activity HflC (stomatin/prohibitin superfamily)